MELHHLPVKRVTDGPRHHFFGYFDKFPWDRTGKRLLAHEIDFTARQPEPGEKAVLGVIENELFNPVAESDAWCWQQGCMLQWLNDADRSVIYNDRDGDRFVSRILDLDTGERRTICRPVYCLSPDGRWALSLNFSRLDRERPGYGYPGAADPTENEPMPADDGIFLVDLKANTARLIVSVAEITDRFYRSDMTGAGWFNHLLFSPDSRRFAFFHRWRLFRPDGTPWHQTHMFTADLDGGDIWPLNLENMSSHYVWTDPEHLVNYSFRHAAGNQYYLYTDRSHRTEIIGQGVFPGDGHCSFSPDGRWMLTDSYPQKDQCRKLYLYRLADGAAFEIGSFYADPAYPVPTRCDLHPNWSRDGRTVCIDSIHEGSRQLYTLDVSPLTAP